VALISPDHFGYDAIAVCFLPANRLLVVVVSELILEIRDVPDFNL